MERLARRVVRTFWTTDGLPVNFTRLRASGISTVHADTCWCSCNSSVNQPSSESDEGDVLSQSSSCGGVSNGGSVPFSRGFRGCRAHTFLYSLPALERICGGPFQVPGSYLSFGTRQKLPSVHATSLSLRQRCFAIQYHRICERRQGSIELNQMVDLEQAVMRLSVSADTAPGGRFASSSESSPDPSASSSRTLSALCEAAARPSSEQVQPSALQSEEKDTSRKASATKKKKKKTSPRTSKPSRLSCNSSSSSPYAECYAHTGIMVLGNAHAFPLPDLPLEPPDTVEEDDDWLPVENDSKDPLSPVVSAIFCSCREEEEEEDQKAG
eukprot:RCo052871